MTNEIADVTLASSAFSCRCSLRDLTLRSQALDHAFCAGLASAVEKASISLSGRFSNLMQELMPSWSNQVVMEFSQETSVKSELILTWKASVDRLRAQESEAAEATSSRILAEKTRSKYAGFLGAKRGEEREYAIAKAKYGVALAEEKRLASQAKDALAKAEVSGKGLMEELMRNAAGIAGSRHCPGLQEELRGVAEDAEKSLASFRKQQIDMARSMSGQVANLVKIYGG